MAGCNVFEDLFLNLSDNRNACQNLTLIHLISIVGRPIYENSDDPEPYPDFFIYLIE